MSNNRFNAKRDANEPSIVFALRAVGAVVFPLNERGCPDLLVGYGDEWHLIEVKLPNAPKRGKGSTLTPQQREWWDVHARRGGTCVIVTTERQALWAIGAFDEATKGLGDG